MKQLTREFYEIEKPSLFVECYSHLLPYEKAQYWQEVLDSLR